MSKPRPKRSVVWTIPHDRLITIITQSRSFSDVLRSVGLKVKGGNIATLKRRLLADGIDFRSLANPEVRRRRGVGDSRPLEEVLVQGSAYSRRALKGRLLKCGLLKEACAECGLGPVWQGKRLVLALDHINGVSDDNRIENLRLICPNCHSQTSTFAARNKKPVVNTNLLCACGESKSDKSLRCRACFAASNEIVEWPNDRELIAMVRSTNMNQVARRLGVTFTAVKKRLKSHGLLV